MDVTQRLKKSVDYAHYRFYAAFGLGYATVLSLFCTLMIGIALISENRSLAVLWVTLLLPYLLFSPLWAYGIVKMREILNDAEHYVILSGKMGLPHLSFARAIWFEVETKEYGTLHTNSVFTTSLWGERSAEVWMKKSVKLAYDPNDGRVVILARQGEL